MIWPYVIFYRDFAEGIRVERVLHGARDAVAIFGDRVEGDREEEE